MRSIVIVAVGAEIESSVSNYLENWYAAGIMRDFILLNHLGEVSDRSPIRAVASDEDPSVQTLLANLGIQHVDYLLVRPSWAEPGPLDELALELRSISADATRIHTLGLRTVNVLCPPRELLPGALEWRVCRGQWDATLVLAPEDRMDERSVTASSDDLDNLGARAALGVAVVAGLASGIDAAPIATIHTPQDTVRLFRCFGRLILGPPTFRDNLRAELDEIRTDEARMASCVGGLPASDPEQQIVNVAGAFASRVGQGALIFSPYRPKPPPQKTDVTWRKALTMLLTFLKEFVLREARRVTVEVAERALAAAQERANQLLFGPDSAYQLVLPGGTTEETGLKQVAEQVLWNDSNAAVYVSAQPVIWQDLRSTIFGLVDGSPALDYLPAISFNDQPLVVARPELLAPLPAEDGLHSTMAGDVVLPAIDRACDAAAAAKWRLRLKSTPVQLATSGEGPLENESHDEGDLEDTEAIGSAILQSLDEWEDHRKNAFTYVVARQMAKALSLAEASLQNDVKQLEFLKEPTDSESEGGLSDEDDKDNKKLHPIRRRRIVRVTAALAFVVAMFLAPLIAFFVGFIGLIVMIAFEVVLAMGATWHLLTRWVRRARREFQEEHRLLLEVWKAEQITAATLHDAAELLRLSSRYDELMEWSDLLAEVVHNPFSERSLEPCESADSVSGPLSLSIADARIEEPKMDRLASKLGGRLFERGWLTRLFTDSSKDANREIRLRRGRDGERQGLEADYDVAGKNGEITRLRTALNLQERSKVLDEGVTQFVTALTPTELFEERLEVRRSGRSEELVPFLKSLEPQELVTPFDATLSMNPADSELRDVDEDPLIWGIDDLASGKSPVPRSPQTRRAFRAAWRLDVSRPAAQRCLRRPSEFAESTTDDDVLPTV